MGWGGVQYGPPLRLVMRSLHNEGTNKFNLPYGYFVTLPTKGICQVPIALPCIFVAY